MIALPIEFDNISDRANLAGPGHNMAGQRGDMTCIRGSEVRLISLLLKTASRGRTGPRQQCNYRNFIDVWQGGTWRTSGLASRTFPVNRMVTLDTWLRAEGGQI